MIRGCGRYDQQTLETELEKFGKALFENSLISSLQNFQSKLQENNFQPTMLVEERNFGSFVQPKFLDESLVSFSQTSKKPSIIERPFYLTKLPFAKFPTFPNFHEK